MLIEAQVISITLRSLAVGQRIYTVFKTVDNQEIGIWAAADHPALMGLRLGDTVALKRNSQGHLHLAPQGLSAMTQLGIFNLLQSTWRLI